jgi:hypothetical protein
MKFRLVLLFVASLAVTTAASAGCNICFSYDRWEGTCQASGGPWCQGMCCLTDEGAWCDPMERVWGCSEQGVAVPASYFSTSLPAVTEGSALRLRLGKGLSPARKCAGASVMLQARPAKRVSS